MVPKALRDRIWATYRSGQEDDWNPSRRYLDAAREAVIAVAEKEGRTPDTRIYDAFIQDSTTPPLAAEEQMRKRKLCEHGNGVDDCSRCNLICDPQCGEWYCDEKEGQIAARDAEIAKLKRQLVWAVRHDARIVMTDGDPRPILDWHPDGEYDPAGFVFDGTDDGLLASIDEAMEEK